MVTMKTLSNSRGISLVILIVAMTLITILGVSFVSIMASKQKGFLYQIDSYRALNLANAGVEFAIRYAYEETNRPNSSLFTSDPYDSPVYGFHGGTFRYRYDYSEVIGNDSLIVTGNHNGSIRQARVRQFRNYAFENLTLIPGNVPFLFGNNVVIPLVTNINRSNDTTIVVTRIDVSVAFSGGGSPRNLERIYMSITDTNYFQNTVYDYSSGGSGALPLPIPPSQSMSTTPAYSVSVWEDPPANTRSSRVWCALQFESGASLSGVYSITFAFTNGQISIVTFTV
ncbi:MAG: hypothetical protein A4E62_02558 [Syntrophorhabdus sp. PtaU1.Bin002]|nr:MAG: hypothetical protein A4E62_02558 [Syntrophorhabdus sp. PtaU1.Bin002]